VTRVGHIDWVARKGLLRFVRAPMDIANDVEADQVDDSGMTSLGITGHLHIMMATPSSSNGVSIPTVTRFKGSASFDHLTDHLRSGSW
jgi:hypothetical protein